MLGGEIYYRATCRPWGPERSALRLARGETRQQRRRGATHLELPRVLREEPGGLLLRLRKLRLGGRLHCPRHRRVPLTPAGRAVTVRVVWARGHWYRAGPGARAAREVGVTRAFKFESGRQRVLLLRDSGDPPAARRPSRPSDSESVRTSRTVCHGLPGPPVCPPVRPVRSCCLSRKPVLPSPGPGPVKDFKSNKSQRMRGWSCRQTVATPFGNSP